MRCKKTIIQGPYGPLEIVTQWKAAPGPLGWFKAIFGYGIHVGQVEGEGVAEAKTSMIENFCQVNQLALPEHAHEQARRRFFPLYDRRGFFWQAETYHKDSIAKARSFARRAI